VAATVSDLWKLLGESKLLAPQHLKQLADEFAAGSAGAEPNARSLAQWLVSRKAVTRYQAVVLLAGRSGPFFYGDYKVTDRLEQGALAGAFRAVHIASGHPVLLRFLSGAILGDAKAWEVARRQSGEAAKIVSPHVQRHFDAVDLGKYKFFVSEDVCGSSLGEKLGGAKLAPAEACRLARLIALGLDAIHERGGAYGDLRTASVALESAGKQQPLNPKLLVFSPAPPAAIDFADQQPESRLAVMADYLAPELWTPGRGPDSLTDVYALGCLLYQMLAGSPPFAGGDVQQKFTRHTSEPVQPLEQFGVPQPLAQVVMYLMAKNPAVRYSSAKLAAEQMAVFVEPAALRARPPAPPATLAAFERSIVRTPTAEAAPAAGPPFAVNAAPVNPAPTSEFAFASPPPVSEQASQPAIVQLGVQLKSRTRPSRSAEEILRARKRQRQRNLVLGLLALVVLTAGGGGFGYWWVNRPKPAIGTLAKVQQPDAEDEAGANGDASPVAATGDFSVAKAGVPAAGNAKASSGGPHIIPDDGQTLWASPTSGEPIAFRCVPPEGQAFLLVRPAALFESPEGQRVLAALGPAFAAQRENWERESGFKLAEVERLLVTLHNNDAKFPRASFVVTTKEAYTKEQLLERWGGPSETKEKDEPYFTGQKWAFYIPAAGEEDERTFAMGESRDIKEVAAAKGAAPPMFREIERLRRASDSERHVTLLLFPQFLFNDDGQPLFAGQRAKVRESLSWLLGDHLQAVSISGHFDNVCYFEMRMLGSLDKEPYQLTEELRNRLDAAPRRLEDYFVALDPPPYWKRLAIRFPGMMSDLHSQLRIGVENDQAIMNVILPETAAHNLVLGGELLISTTPGAGSVAVSAPASASSVPKTIEDALKLKTSFSFESQSLEFAMRDLAEEVQSNLKGAPFEFSIKIIGDDLKLDGITRNQTIRDFKQDNQTVADILTALVRKANPVTTVKEPSETDQKLVWLIGPDPEDPAKQAVLITTRTAAATKEYQLPAPFVTKSK
jgi:eukaryotic-like serine/threonine-protein kinase